MSDAVTAWARCRPWIQSSLPYAGGAYTIEDIEQMLALGKLTLISDDQCAMLLEVTTYPQFKALNIFAAGGKLKALRARREWLEQAAKSLGCRRIEARSRRGLSRALRDLGVEEKQVFYWKDI